MRHPSLCITYLKRRKIANIGNYSVWSEKDELRAFTTNEELEFLKPCACKHVCWAPLARSQAGHGAHCPLHITPPGKPDFTLSLVLRSSPASRLGRNPPQILYCRWTPNTYVSCWKYMHHIHQLNPQFPNSGTKTALAWNRLIQSNPAGLEKFPKESPWVTFIFVSSFVA